MNFTEKDYQDLLKLADIIEKKEFFNKLDFFGRLSFDLPEDKKDGSQFNLSQYFFDCGMPACAASHALCEFPKRFKFTRYVKGHTVIDNVDFAQAFNLDEYEALEITMPSSYSSENPKPKTVARRIRMIAQKALEAKP